MQNDPSSPGAPSPFERLSDLLAALLNAGDERSLLEALVKHLSPWTPSSVNVIYFDLDAQGTPVTGSVVAAYANGQIVEGISSAVKRFSLDASGFTALWMAAPQEPLFLSDVATDARADAALRALSEATGGRAFIVLPLYSAAYGGWQGMVTIDWNSSRPFSEQGRVLCRLLMAAIAAHVGGWRSRDALRAALAEAELLHAISRRLNEASGVDETIVALAQASPTLEGVSVTMSTFDDAEPDWVTVLHRWTGPGRASKAMTGLRLFLPNDPFSKEILSSPNEPVLVSDAEIDPRTEGATRAAMRAYGVRALLSMLLTLRGRRVGVFTITWTQPVPLGERERRIYSALSTQAALLIENRLVLERLHESLAKTEQKSATLSTLLDHLPVGVVLFARSGERLLSNPAAERVVHVPRFPGEETEEGAGYRVVYPDTDETMPMADRPGRRALLSGETETCEMDIMQPNGDRMHVETIAAPVRDEAGEMRNVVLLFSDITARKVSERERARLQEEVIRVQEATLAELSSPLIPITDDIVVLPLIGSLSAARGQQVIDALLSGTSRNRAKVAILDITGLRSVDTQAASMITSAAQALRLLGVEPILTGIQPEVAQTLVTLGAPLDGIATRGTLQSGVQYALRHLGRSMLR